MDQHPNQFAFFRDMIESVSPIYITEFDEQYQILYSSNPHPELLRMLYREDEKGPVPLGYEMDSIGARMTSPVVFTNSIGMTWLSDVYVEEEKVRRIYLMGPVFLDDFSLRRIEPKVNKLQLSIPRKHEFLSLLRELPVVTLNRYFDYGIMLHRAVTGEVITRDAFLYPDRVQ